MVLVCHAECLEEEKEGGELDELQDKEEFPGEYKNVRGVCQYISMQFTSQIISSKFIT